MRVAPGAKTIQGFFLIEFASRASMNFTAGSVIAEDLAGEF